jgi:hypothetical protein
MVAKNSENLSFRRLILRGHLKSELQGIALLLEALQASYSHRWLLSGS